MPTNSDNVQLFTVDFRWYDRDCYTFTNTICNQVKNARRTLGYAIVLTT